MDGEAELLLVDSLVGLSNVDKPVWSRDGRSIYFVAADSTGSSGLYVMPAAGGRPQLRVRYDDPTKAVWRAYSISNGKLYVSIAEYESDIYVMDLDFR